jgi:DNA-binding LacI/PurR family transcriptional regulator
MSQLAARGLGVGRDISVIGIDDSWLAQMSSPLTSVSQPVEDTGRTAMLVDGPRGPLATAEPRIITLPSRPSCGRVSALDPLSADNLTATGGGARNTAS